MSIVKQSLESLLIEAIQKDADLIREVIIRDAVDRFESDLRARVLTRAVDLTRHYDLSRSGEYITLRVRVDPQGLPTKQG